MTATLSSGRIDERDDWNWDMDGYGCHTGRDSPDSILYITGPVAPGEAV